MELAVVTSEPHDMVRVGSNAEGHRDTFDASPDRQLVRAEEVHDSARLSIRSDLHLPWPGEALAHR